MPQAPITRFTAHLNANSPHTVRYAGSSFTRDARSAVEGEVGALDRGAPLAPVAPDLGAVLGVLVGGGQAPARGARVAVGVVDVLVRPVGARAGRADRGQLH